ncbi:hypothetical protein EYF80_068099 [Liparis tanakae]|uniref:Uncharacterized protein n=1 Tax=Liparis tanakae TaxID=230148 RepID=A0A4Z2DZA1_9TELE|nr:hypothetical protein EYF80_068099 [Liparis tanakae]
MKLKTSGRAWVQAQLGTTPQPNRNMLGLSTRGCGYSGRDPEYWTMDKDTSSLRYVSKDFLQPGEKKMILTAVGTMVVPEEPAPKMTPKMAPKMATSERRPSSSPRTKAAQSASAELS